jgi:hypothetical protein
MAGWPVILTIASVSVSQPPVLIEQPVQIIPGGQYRPGGFAVFFPGLMQHRPGSGNLHPQIIQRSVYLIAQ